MKLFPVILLVWLTSLSPALPCPQQVPQAPADRPVAAGDAEGIQKFEEAIAPYIKKARATLPQAKQRYLKGLPKGEQFLVTIRIYDRNGHFEQVFLRVTSWVEHTITGVLASHVSILDYKVGRAIACKERDVLDWTIRKADGSEEGNFVGKFLDSYKP